MKKRNGMSRDLSGVIDILRGYKRSKLALEQRIESERKFWQDRCYGGSEASSAWLFNSIVSKHADITDNLPIGSCLPREECDGDDAQLLSEILPIIIDRCNFKETYSDNAWKKLKYGTAIYGVFWNNALENGLGDVDICGLRQEDVFWEPCVRDVQDSKNLFICRIWDIENFRSVYPNFDYESSRREIDALGCELYGGGFDTQNKCVVVDRYYKKVYGDGKSVLHLCKFCGGSVLYCSEDDERCSGGWYEHGNYPVVFDTLYPDEESLHGFGVISIAKNTQNAIDRIDGNLLEYADWSSRVRFWAKKSLGVNERDFSDLSHRIVEVEGDIDTEKLQQIETAKIDGSVIDFRGLKIDELKETTGTRDFLQGGTTGGVVAATAIKRLQESGDKYSRDGIEGSCRAYAKILYLVIELIRQFYDVPRYFRIKGECGDSKFICYSHIGASVKDGKEQTRRPHFDIEISTSKKSTSYAENANTLALELYESGVFNPENVEQSLVLLELMSFDGIGKVKKMLLNMRDSKSANHDGGKLTDNKITEDVISESFPET